MHDVPQDDHVDIYKQQVELEVQERLGKGDLLPPHLRSETGLM